jgi:hypothetical protein
VLLLAHANWSDLSASIDYADHLKVTDSLLAAVRREQWISALSLAASVGSSFAPFVVRYGR